MNVQSTAAAFLLPSALKRSPSDRQVSSAAVANVADTVRISQAGRDAFAASSSSADVSNERSVEARLAEIRSRGAVNRSQEDHDFLFANDKRLAEISAKAYASRTADEIDYLQKSAGFVNTFAYLNASERALYDKAVANGDTAAAEGIAQIALIRQGGEMAGGANGTTYNPRTTEITAANIERFFTHSIVDHTGNAGSKFQALIRFLQSDPAA